MHDTQSGTPGDQALTGRLVLPADRLYLDTAAPVAHFLGVRPPRAESMALVANALTAAGVVVTARHGLLRIAPHLHVGVDDMRRVAAIAGDASRAVVPVRG